jgi:S-adenosylmethionine hydrolase
VAAHLTAGLLFAEVGQVVEQIVELDTAGPTSVKGGLKGRILHVDRFGNLITNLEARHLRQLPAGEPRTFRISRRVVRKFGRFYAEAAPGEAIALIGSSNQVEICVNVGSAQQKFGARSGDRVVVR